MQSKLWWLDDHSQCDDSFVLGMKILPPSHVKKVPWPAPGRAVLWPLGHPLNGTQKCTNFTTVRELSLGVGGGGKQKLALLQPLHYGKVEMGRRNSSTPPYREKYHFHFQICWVLLKNWKKSKIHIFQTLTPHFWYKGVFAKNSAWSKYCCVYHVFWDQSWPFSPYLIQFFVFVFFLYR